MGDGGLASNFYGNGSNSSVGENTIKHSYAGKAKTKQKNSTIKTSKPNKGK